MKASELATDLRTNMMRKPIELTVADVAWAYRVSSTTAHAALSSLVTAHDFRISGKTPAGLNKYNVAIKG